MWIKNVRQVLQEIASTLKELQKIAAVILFIISIFLGLKYSRARTEVKILQEQIQTKPTVITETKIVRVPVRVIEEKTKIVEHVVSEIEPYIYIPEVEERTVIIADEAKQKKLGLMVGFKFNGLRPTIGLSYKLGSMNIGVNYDTEVRKPGIFVLLKF